jgi:arsenate reductase (thioredoxin)
MYSKLKETISEITQDFESIPVERKQTLQDVADYISKELKEHNSVKLNFICTHNSRRSHLAQIWTQTAATHYGVEALKLFPAEQKQQLLIQGP